MNTLITIASATIGGASIPTVNARDLHAQLRVKRDFSTWIKSRISQYGFVEGEDYVTVENACSPDLASGKKQGVSGVAFDSPNLVNQSGRGGDRRSIDYHLSLDMAKELAMIENNPQGRAARRYFIAAEQQARAVLPAVDAAALIEELLRAHPEWAKVSRYLGLGLNTPEIALLLQRDESTVRRYKSRMSACGLLPTRAVTA